jgi:hypothetical protein
MTAETIDIIVNKMFDFIDYLYEILYENNLRDCIIIELGNIYTIEEEEEEEEEEIMDKFILI